MAVGGFQPMLNLSGTLPNLIPSGAENWMRCDVFWLVFALPKFNQHTHVMHLQHPNFSPKFCSGVLDTPHSTLYTQHFTLDTLDTTFYTWHCARLTPCWVTDCMSLHTVHSTCFKRYCPPFFPLFSTICLRFFFLPFSCHSSIFLHFPPAFNDFPSFSVVFFLPFSCRSSIFLHFPPVFNDFPSFFSYLFPDFLPVFNDFPSFSLVFSSLFPAGVNGPRGNRSLSSPLCVVVYAPQKSSMCPPSTATNFEILAPYATTTPPQTP